MLYDSIARHISVFSGTVDRWEIPQRPHDISQIELDVPSLNVHQRLFVESQHCVHVNRSVIVRHSLIDAVRAKIEEVY